MQDLIDQVATWLAEVQDDSLGCVAVVFLVVCGLCFESLNGCCLHDTCVCVTCAVCLPNNISIQL